MIDRAVSTRLRCGSVGDQYICEHGNSIMRACRECDGAELVHVPSIMAVAKMDTPMGLHRGTCSCEWVSRGLGNEQNAWRDARQHADAKNTD